MTEVKTPTSEWTGTGEIASAVGVSHATVRKMLAEAGTPVKVLEKNWRIRRSDAETFIKSTIQGSPSDYVSPVAMAAELGASPTTVRRYLVESGTPVLRIAKRWLVKKDAAEKFIEAMPQMLVDKKAETNSRRSQTVRAKQTATAA